MLFLDFDQPLPWFGILIVHWSCKQFLNLWHTYQKATNPQNLSNFRLFLLNFIGICFLVSYKYIAQTDTFLTQRSCTTENLSGEIKEFLKEQLTVN